MIKIRFYIYWHYKFHILRIELLELLTVKLSLYNLNACVFLFHYDLVAIGISEVILFLVAAFLFFKSMPKRLRH